MTACILYPGINPCQNGLTSCQSGANICTYLDNLPMRRAIQTPASRSESQG